MLPACYRSAQGTAESVYFKPEQCNLWYRSHKYVIFSRQDQFDAGTGRVAGNLVL